MKYIYSPIIASILILCSCGKKSAEPLAQEAGSKLTANEIFVNIAKNIEQAETQLRSGNNDAAIELYKEAIEGLEQIINEHKSSDLAAKIVSGSPLLNIETRSEKGGDVESGMSFNDIQKRLEGIPTNKQVKERAAKEKKEKEEHELQYGRDKIFPTIEEVAGKWAREFGEDKDPWHFLENGSFYIDSKGTKIFPGSTWKIAKNDTDEFPVKKGDIIITLDNYLTGDPIRDIDIRINLYKQKMMIFAIEKRKLNGNIRMYRVPMGIEAYIRGETDPTLLATPFIKLK